MSIRVLLVDDQAMVRAGLRMLLSTNRTSKSSPRPATGWRPCARPPGSTHTSSSWTSGCPSSTDSRPRAASSPPTTPCRVLVLTTFNLDDYVYEALRAGASGFVLKDDPPEQLIAAVHTIAAGDALLSPSVTRSVIAHFTRRHRQPPPTTLDTLTTREMDVFRLIALGILQRRDRPRALHQRHHGQNARHPAAAKAPGPRPSAGDRPGLSIRRLPHRARARTRTTRPLRQHEERIAAGIGGSGHRLPAKPSRRRRPVS